MKRIRISLLGCLIILFVILSGCANRQNERDVQKGRINDEYIYSTASSEQTNTSDKSKESISIEHEMPSIPSTIEVIEWNIQDIEITANGKIFSATLNDNETARAFSEMLPLTLEMRDYSGFEKVGSLEKSLPTSNIQITTQSGDIVLYNGNQIVVFYGSNSWSYTRLGKIDDLTGWKEALGDGDVSVTFQIKE